MSETATYYNTMDIFCDTKNLVGKKLIECDTENYFIVIRNFISKIIIKDYINVSNVKYWLQLTLDLTDQNYDLCYNFYNLFDFIKLKYATEISMKQNEIYIPITTKIISESNKFCNKFNPHFFDRSYNKKPPILTEQEIKKILKIFSLDMKDKKIILTI